MSESSGELIIREHYNRFCRSMFVLSAAVFAGGGLYAGYGVNDLYTSGESRLAVFGASLGTALLFVTAYGLLRQYLELRVNGTHIRARAWPFPWTKIGVEQVINSEIVEIDPFRDYGGWGMKGIAQDRLIGGGDTTALRITYTHESGETRKLTFLTDRAEEVDKFINIERTVNS